MQKIVVNRCYGIFSLSKEAYDALGIEWDNHGDKYISDHMRNDPELVKVVIKLGDKANGRFATLEIVNVPDGVEWIIEERDGMEWVAEVHRIW